MFKVLAFLAAIPCTGYADTVTGNDLHSACTANGEIKDLQFGYCIGYIGGAFEGIKFGAGAVMFQAMPESSTTEVDQASNAMLGFCIPENVERGQIVDVTMKYLEENPQSRHESARGLLFQALQSAFPC
ncbi:Rap1a/Tai family immunity protein [Celeribacter sp.]|uniref:Rap1a/Tai family immunity protein n=1 Tax=Celeribacter sp. TaxID=1890673 RepID=UPI003A8EF64E